MTETLTKTQRLLVEAMIKHLPPSSARLKLWDVGGKVGAVFLEQRADLDIVPVSEDVTQWDAGENLADSVVAFAPPAPLSEPFLKATLRVLRQGGRLIMIDPQANPDKALVQQLESVGHTRILVETAIECPLPLGVLMRGEKPHQTQSTFARIRVASDADADNLVWETYDGAYIYLLVRQAPNKPVWALSPDDVLRWSAVRVGTGESGALVAFTSLPKAVSFMQQAIMQRVLGGINKVGKFHTATARAWEQPLLLNPLIPDVKVAPFWFWDVDPTTAAASDE